MRFTAVPVLALLVLASCSAKENSHIELAPGDRGTFVALGTETELDVTEAPKESEDGFKFVVKAIPSKGISIGRAVGNHQADNNESKYFVPASITKVVTSSLALKLLGPDYRFTTRVSWYPEEEGRGARDLTVYADGDPFTTKERLKSIAEELKKRGVQKLTGSLNLISSDARKDFSFPPYGLDSDDYFNCYASRAQAFNLQRNCASAQILGRGQAHWLDSGIQAPLLFSSSAGDAAKLKMNLLLKQPAGFLTGYTVASAPQGKKYELGLAVPNAKAWFGNSLRQELIRAGIDARDLQIVSNQKVEGGEMRSFEIQSAPLGSIIVTMNKHSDNWLAEALFKASADFDADSNIQTAAMNVVKAGVLDWMTSEGTADFANEIQLYDGAGLSRANQVTPRAFLTLLKAFTKEPLFPKLWASLPIAGVDGTLRGRMGTGSAAGTVRAKTGTLKGCYQLAGYIPKLDERGEIAEYVPFVILSQTTPDQRGGARSFQDRLLGELAAQINKGKSLKRETPAKRKRARRR
jgi:D-alanyl-D-alanine carboxypeptidase/D-alanyl-D-alanine-endopeptidase (penicillin-binding protein 4)